MNEMWMRRLRTFSHRRLSSLAQVSEEFTPSIDELILTFANHSPRDAIRIGAQILAEQQEIDSTSDRNSHSTKLSRNATLRGIEKFCSTRSSELVDENTLRELRKIRKVDFTIPYLSNAVFREKQTNTRNRIIKWLKGAAVVQVNHIDDPHSKQDSKTTLFAIEDPRIAKLICSDLNVFEFLEQKYRSCPICKTFVLRDWDEPDSVSICHNCQFDWAINLQDEYEIWLYSKRAAERKAIRREERVQQLSFADLLLSQFEDS